VPPRIFGLLWITDDRSDILHAPARRTLAVFRRIGQARPDIFRSQTREVIEKFGNAHASGQIFQDILDRHARTADARLAAPFSRLDRDDLAPVHVVPRLNRAAFYLIPIRATLEVAIAPLLGRR